MEHNIGMDRESMGQDYDSTLCPEECRGETREACCGCPYFDEEGEPIE